jgi:hypothetical protein
LDRRTLPCRSRRAQTQRHPPSRATYVCPVPNHPGPAPQLSLIQQNFDKTPLEVIELFGKLDFVTSFHLIPVGGITPLPDGCEVHWKDVRSLHRLGKESSWFTSGSLYHLLLGTARGMNNSQLNRLSKTQLGGAPTQRTIRNRRFWQGGHHGEEAYQT